MEHNYNFINDSVPQEFGLLALRLHEQNCQLLSIKYSGSGLLDPNLKQNKFWSIDENKVVFPSLEARNHVVAVHAYHEYLQNPENIEPSYIFKLAHDLWRNEIGHDDFSSGRFLSLASKHINVLLAAAKLIESENEDVFDILQVVEVALKYLPIITAEELCRVVTAQSPKTERDLARGQIFNAIEKVLIEEPDLALDLYNHLKINISEPTMNLVASALISLAQSREPDTVASFMLDDLNSENILLNQKVIWAFGRILNSFDLQLDIQNRCINAIKKNAKSPVEEIRFSATQAIAHAALKHPSPIDELLELSESSDKNTLSILANHVHLNFDSLKQYKNLPDLLEALTNITPDMVNAIQDIDWFLYKLLKSSEKAELVSRYLRSWVIKNGNEVVRDKKTIELFAQTIRALVENPTILQKLITEWFVAKEIQLVSANSELISSLWVHNYKNPSFSNEILDQLDSEDFILLARRMLGYIFTVEPLLSLTFSLLTTDASITRTFSLVYSLLTNEVGKNYLKNTLDEIDSRIDTAAPDLRNMLEKAKNELVSYRDQIADLPLRQELIPPFQLRRALMLNQASENRKLMEASKEKSVFLMITKQIKLKAGLGSFTVNNGNVSDISYLNSFSYETPLPRRYISDPIQYEIDGFMYRTAKKGQE